MSRTKAEQLALIKNGVHLGDQYVVIQVVVVAHFAFNAVPFLEVMQTLCLYCTVELKKDKKNGTNCNPLNTSTLHHDIEYCMRGMKTMLPGSLVTF